MAKKIIIWLFFCWMVAGLLQAETILSNPPSSASNIELLNFSMHRSGFSNKVKGNPQKVAAASVSASQVSGIAASSGTGEQPQAPAASSGPVAAANQYTKTSNVSKKEPTDVEKELDAHNGLIPASKTTVQPQQAALPKTVSGTKTASEAAQPQTAVSEDSAASISPASSAPAVTASSDVYNPNVSRPGVEWKKSASSHFIIYTQKRNAGITSPNMHLIFENAYETLRRNIPWMMADKVRVFVYQDLDNYLRYEPQATKTTRALAYPLKGEIVVYDVPGRQRELQEVFTHELVHIFTQKFFDKHNGKLATPLWLDEGLAVYMEDHVNREGGVWSEDLKTLNFKRAPQKISDTFQIVPSNHFERKPRRIRRGKPIFFMPFSQFVEENSLEILERRGGKQDWYFQAYAMVYFLLNPTGSTLSPSKRFNFEQFTRLLAKGEQMRDPETGYPIYKQGKPVYKVYSLAEALGRTYHYNSLTNMEDNFWDWVHKLP